MQDIDAVYDAELVERGDGFRSVVVKCTCRRAERLDFTQRRNSTRSSCFKTTAALSHLLPTKIVLRGTFLEG